jgi:zinc protease
MRPSATVLALSLVAGACAVIPPPPAAAPPAAPAVAAEPSLAPAVPARPEPPVPAEVVAPRFTPDAEFRTQRPLAGSARPFKVPAVKRFRLKNGLKVILAESHRLPLVGVELVIKTGNAANPRGKAGLADLVADMLDEGTRTRNALAIADDIATLGATLGTNAGWDATSLSISGLSENIDRALAIWADVLLEPAFDEKELGRVRDNLLTALQRRKDSPPLVAGINFARVLYGENHPYGWPATGTQQTIKTITPADLRKFWETFYRPNNAVLVVAGDITAAEVRAKVEPLLKQWKARPVPRVNLPRAVAMARTKVFLVDKAGAPQSSIRIGLVGIDRRSPDYYRAVVMNHILGGGFKRLGLNLRENKGWTYGVSSFFDARRTPGPWTAGGEFVAVHTAESVAEILKEVRSLREAEVSDKELQETKDELIKAFPARFATVNQIAAQMVTLAVYDLPDNDLESYTRKLAAVTRADVHRMAQKYLNPDHMAVVVVGDQKSNEAPLRKIADLELRDLDGNPLPAPAGPAASAAR